MINSKADLREYLAQDKIQLGITRKYPRPFTDEIWKYEIILRKYEYWLNVSKSYLVKKIGMCFYKLKWHQMGVKFGISIAPNVCGKGLSIAHINCININQNASVGDNCRIHEGVTIGASGGSSAPSIGKNVFLGSGCKVMGNVNVPNNCVVGANAVVVKDVPSHSIVVGVPAKVIKTRNSITEKWIKVN